MRSGRRKRERTGSLSPPMRPSYGGSSATDRNLANAALSAPPSPSTFVGLIQYRTNTSNINGSRSLNPQQRQALTMRHNLLHMQALQEVLRRTSLAEMRDREVVEWLLGTERWLREFHQPLMPVDTCATSSGSAGGGASNNTNNNDALINGGAGAGHVSSSQFPPGVASIGLGDAFSRTYSGVLTELRLLVIGVLQTMPWWRVVETVAKSHSGVGVAGPGRATGHGSSGGGGGGGNSSSSATGVPRRGAGRREALSAAAAAAAADRALAARHAITRWHVRLQVAFERVCMVLIEKSQHTVRGVLEVLLKPCQLRPPVRDGARRSIPSDSFIRVLNAVATLYSSTYVIELLEGCIADFMPRRRWAERRHHVACTAVLLYVALEGHTPAYHPRLGNSQSLQRAIELLKSLRMRSSNAEEGGSPWRLPRATRSSSLPLGAGTSEDSGTDVGGGALSSSSLSALPYNSSRHRQRGGNGGGTRAMLPSGGGVLPAGYVSATLFEDARSGGLGLRQPRLTRPGDAVNFGSGFNTNLPTTTASDTELSDGAVAPGAEVMRESDGGWIARDAAANIIRGGESDGSSTANLAKSRRPRNLQNSSDVGSGGGGVVGKQGSIGSFLSESADAGLRGVVAGGGAANTASASATAASLIDVSVEHNNKLLAYRNNIIRLLLNRLLEMEQSLEPREGESQLGGVDDAMSSMGWLSNASFGSGTYAAGGPGNKSVSLAYPSSGLGSPFGSAPPSSHASPSSLFPASAAAALNTGGAMNLLVPNAVQNSDNHHNHHNRSMTGPSGSFLFPSTPVATGAALLNDATAASSALSSPAALSPATFLLSTPHSHPQPHLSLPFGAGIAQPLETYFSSLSLPYLRILRDCTTLVYGRLADDLRRQQVAGSCGNADWWEEILYFYLTIVTRVERPVYLLYLAPSLAMLGTEDEPVNLLHKLITLVTKGSMPVEQPRTTASGIGAAGLGVGGGGGAGASFGRPAAAQPVRLRMAPPTGSSRRVVTMEERRRAARHIYPLFRFLHSRLDEASAEGVRRRLLKWTSSELRRVGGTGFAAFSTAGQRGVSGNTTNNDNNNNTNSNGGGSGNALGIGSGIGGSFANQLYLRSRQTPSRESRLALVTFAQCAAISELMDVDLVPSSTAAKGEKSASGSSSKETASGRFTTTSVAGDASDSIAAPLQPLLARYTLLTEQPVDPNEEADAVSQGGTSGGSDGPHDDDGARSDSNSERDNSPESSASSSDSALPRKSNKRRQQQQQRRFDGAKAEGRTPVVEAAPRRQLDLRQMEFEGLLQPRLMANCPWQAWLR